MAAVKQLTQSLLDTNIPLTTRISNAVASTLALSIDMQQELVRQLAFILYQRQPTCGNQLSVLEFVKGLMITGSYPLFLLVNVYIFPWIISFNGLHPQRTLNTRAQLLFKDAAGQQQVPGGVQSYRQLLQFTSQFIVFFGENAKYHPESKYKIKHALARELSKGSHSRSLEYFSEKDTQKMKTNLKEYSNNCRADMLCWSQFVAGAVEKCLTDPASQEDTSFLLMGLVQLSQSFCISTIVYAVCGYLAHPNTAVTACEFLNSIVIAGEIEAIELVNSKCIPIMLEYLLPIDFTQNTVRTEVKKTLDHQSLNKLVDYFYLWEDKTKMAGLSTRIYEHAHQLVQLLKKPTKLTYQQELKEFSGKLAKMKSANESKRAFIIDQNQQIQKFVVRLLNELDFCLSSQIKQKVAYSNVLDELSSDQFSNFSESLVKSAVCREEGRENSIRSSKGLRKKFEGSQISQIKEKVPSKLSGSSRQSAQNIYYVRSSAKMPHIPADVSRSKSGIGKTPIYLKERYDQSSRQVYEASAKTVQAKNQGTPPLSSKNDSISIHSSQFSQKDNLGNKQKVSSIYLQRDNDHSDQSGDFVHFQNDSLARSEHKKKPLEYSEDKPQDSEIMFEDSMKLQHSGSQELIQYGIDKAAKLPPSMKKPKFAFKHADTNDSSIILKDIDISQHNEYKQKVYYAVEQNSPVFPYQIRDSRPSQKLQKQTQYTKAIKTEYYKSSRESQKQKQIKSIYLSRQISDKSSPVIKELSAEPYLESSNSSESSVPNNFGSFFRKNKQKKQKASSLSMRSSRSLRTLKRLQKPVQVPDFKKMRNLQNQLGRLKAQTQHYQKVLSQKVKQKQSLLKTKKSPGQEDPYFLRRQNQLIKKMLVKTQPKQEPLLSSHSSARSLAKQLKESSIKNKKIDLKDYTPEILKLKLDGLTAYEKSLKKGIIANRCVLVKNDLLEIGYSFKGKVVTLYFTLRHHCDSLEIDLRENSVIFSQSIKRQFDKVFVGKQMKFKSEVKGTKDEIPFKLSRINVRVGFDQRLQKRLEDYSAELPLTPCSMAIPIDGLQLAAMEEPTSSMTHFVTPLYRSCQDLLLKGKHYLQQIFPHGQFDEDTSTFSFGYYWKGKTQKINVKLKERSFRVEGVGSPGATGRELIDEVVKMLMAASL